MGVTEKYAGLPPLPEDITERLALVPALLRRHPVRLAYAFGSAVRDPAGSRDVDIAVLPAVGFSYTALYAELSLALDTDRLDVVDLRLAPVSLQVEVTTSGRCLLARSWPERLRFELGVRMRWREERRRWLRPPRPRVSGAPKTMELREEFILQSLAELERIAQELDRYREATAEAMAADLSLRWTIERGLLSGLTLLFQVADHVLSTRFRRSVATYEELLAELHGCGVISEALYGRLRGAGGFRNVLVHEYVAIDLGQVASSLHRAPTLLRAFAQELGAWLDRLPEGGPA